ncbi:MAG TPA: hypothetical protein VNH46_13690, partial [Gemmatimonadales bacterium]|nr:hypothetical protein [Gemmatimonadales bacterium]
MTPPPNDARSWSRALGLSALALAGQAAALILVDAPHYAVYQHYRPWTILPGHPYALAVLAVQAVVCLALGHRHRQTLRSGIGHALPGWRA